MTGIWFWVALVGALQGRFFCNASVIRAVDEEQTPRNCWVFSHMNKSGGQSVKLMLRREWVEKSRAVTEGKYDTNQWMRGATFAEGFLRSNFTLTWGGYTEGLRPRGDQHCKWFTVFRHPVSRVVSAYFFCQNYLSDPLCGSDIVDARSVDLLTFAEHWGNYGIRQFLLAFVRPEDVLASNAGSEISACSDHSKAALQNKKCPGWYRLKLFVERQNTCNSLRAQHEGEESACEPWMESLKESWMVNFLNPIEDILTTRYTAVGLLEQWDTTLLLFNATLGIPGFDWPQMFSSDGQRNAYHGQKPNDGFFLEDPKVEMLREAWVEPELKKLLWLDLLLYDHAVQVFNRQVEVHGLV